MSKEQIIKIVISVLIAALTALGAALGLQSCWQCLQNAQVPFMSHSARSV